MNYIHISRNGFTTLNVKNVFPLMERCKCDLYWGTYVAHLSRVKLAMMTEDLDPLLKWEDRVFVIGSIPFSYVDLSLGMDMFNVSQCAIGLPQLLLFTLQKHKDRLCVYEATMQALYRAFLILGAEPDVQVRE